MFALALGILIKVAARGPGSHVHVQQEDLQAELGRRHRHHPDGGPRAAVHVDVTPKLMCCIILFPYFVISLTLATSYIISIFVQFNKTCINNQKITMVAITYSCNSLHRKRFPDRIFLRPQLGEGRASPS